MRKTSNLCRKLSYKYFSTCINVVSGVVRQGLSRPLLNGGLGDEHITSLDKQCWSYRTNQAQGISTADCDHTGIFFWNQPFYIQIIRTCLDTSMKCDQTVSLFDNPGLYPEFFQTTFQVVSNILVAFESQMLCV